MEEWEHFNCTGGCHGLDVLSHKLLPRGGIGRLMESRKTCPPSLPLPILNLPQRTANMDDGYASTPDGRSGDYWSTSSAKEDIPSVTAWEGDLSSQSERHLVLPR